jgi:exodeoxyribonuclease V gamma subunit
LRRAEFRRPPGHPLNDSLAAVADEAALLLPPAGELRPEPAPDTLLGRLQHDLRHDCEPRPLPLAAGDDSVRFHLSHGPDRQVEVLREVLTSVLAADPGLEPRDIVVVTPDVELVAPLLGATFGGDAHPAHEFRVQLADRSQAQTNPLATLLLDLLDLADARFEATTLLELSTHPAIERRFGFGADSRDRLVTLVGQAGVRWGLNAAQRGDFGLAGFRQNTWIAGLQRLLLGVALSERELVTVDTVLPLDDLDSSDLDLIGGLTELVGRLSRLMAEFSRPAPLAEWARRCRDGLAALVRPARGEEWQLSDLVAGLARLAERDPSGTPLTRAAASRSIAEEFRGRAARGAFGNGSLVVCGPGSLRHVPHRVVVLLGWDADRYPRPGRRPGDDLTGLEPLVGDPSPAMADRQALLDALHSAQERLIVVARGRSGATNEEVPLAAPLTELLEALDLTATTADGGLVSRAITVQHPLQPFAPAYFDPDRPDLASADRISLRAALALRGTPAPAPRRYVFEALPPPDLSGGVTLDELTGFFSYPVRNLLKVRAGLSLDGGRADSDAMPIDPGGLERWQIGDRVLQGLRDGLDPLTVERAEWLRGTVPPFELGRALLASVVSDAVGVAKALPQGPPEVHDLAIEVDVPGHGRVPLVGRVAVHGREIVQGQTSRLQARHRLVAWLRLLALAAAEPGPWRARVIGKDEAAGYLAPPQAESTTLLGRYLGLYAVGLSRPLPLPPRFGATWAGVRLRGEDPRGSRTARDQLETDWKRDTGTDPSWGLLGFDYPSVLDLDAVPGLPGADPSEPSLVGALASAIWQPPLTWGQST